jgi:hypothetical protein
VRRQQVGLLSNYETRYTPPSVLKQSTPTKTTKNWAASRYPVPRLSCERAYRGELTAFRSDDTNRIRPSSPDGQRRALLLGRAEGPRNVLRVHEGGVGDHEVRPADLHRRRAVRTNVGCRHRQRAGGIAVADVEGAGRRLGRLVRGLRVLRTAVDALGGPRDADIHRVLALAEPRFLERHGDRVGAHIGDIGENEMGAHGESL